ncbi:MAG: hypothetical protein JSV89_10125 [Spirochaetaceae bacterium]|nr:MAG: hypothetical protein JSV89_10125 [Spirochaetaceae bacterium]
MGNNSSLRRLRLRLLSLLDQKVGREKSILRRSIQALDRRIREKEAIKEAEKPPDRGYPHSR